MLRWLAPVVLAAGIAGAGIGYVLTLRPAFPPVAKPDPATLDPAEVAKGAVLAALGDCIVCHTAEGGAPYAGGRPLATPFGTLYATNITPDEETGIGAWSVEAFRRAMRDGVARDGTHLYPAFPYVHFTRVTDADLDAIRAFLMSRTAVSAVAPANDLVPPLGFRPLLAGWKLLFHHRAGFKPDPARSVDWNRGAYLVEGLGHCGGCHTPLNLLGGEGSPYAGGSAEGWDAPALDGSTPGPRWTVEALETYLVTGMHPDHSAAAGPMGPVVAELSDVPRADVRAMAVYVASLMGDAPPAAAPIATEALDPHGAAVFTAACAGCHDDRAPMARHGRPLLDTAAAVAAKEPTNAIRAILDGIAPPEGRPGPAMPPFTDALGDADIVAVAAYVRARFGQRAAWPDLAAAVASARKDSQ